MVTWLTNDYQRKTSAVKRAQWHSTMIQREVRRDYNITDGDLDVTKEMSVYCREGLLCHMQISPEHIQSSIFKLVSQVFSNSRG